MYKIKKLNLKGAHSREVTIYWIKSNYSNWQYLGKSKLGSERKYQCRLLYSNSCNAFPNGSLKANMRINFPL